MKKLEIVQAAVSRFSRDDKAHRAPLICTWKIDYATGQFVCSWAEARAREPASEPISMERRRRQIHRPLAA